MYTIHHIIRINTKAHMIFSRYRKSIWQNLFIHDKEKTLKKLGIEGNSHYLEKAIYKNLQLQHTQWWPTKYTPLSPNTSVSSLLSPVQHLLEVIANVIWQEKKEKTYSLEIKKYKYPYWRYNLYIENPKESLKKSSWVV